MERRSRAARWAVLGAALLLGAGCASTPPTMADPLDEPGATESAPHARLALDAAGAIHGLEPVYFAFDRSDLDEDARRALRANAGAIEASPEWGVLTIEGHCDERGSDEYNLALGEERAQVVSRYLADLGVPAWRLDTVSFGEAKPAAAGHDEAAWRYNRRSELKRETHPEATR